MSLAEFTVMIKTDVLCFHLRERIFDGKPALREARLQALHGLEFHRYHAFQFGDRSFVFAVGGNESFDIALVLPEPAFAVHIERLGFLLIEDNDYRGIGPTENPDHTKPVISLAGRAGAPAAGTQDVKSAARPE